jgi:hypothetical protein
MRFVPAVASVIALALSSIAVRAQTIDLSWDACAPILQHKMPVAGPVTFHASVTGQSQPHKGYEIWWVVGDANDAIPDAWHFDNLACNAGRFEFATQPTAALAKACPPFISPFIPSVTLVFYQMSPPGLGLPTTLGNGSLGIGSPNHTTTVDPAQRCHAARFTLDFTDSSPGPTVPGVSCGGLNTMVTIRLVPGKAVWLDSALDEFEFEFGNSTLTFGSDAVPASATTWGQIKGQYRN